MFLNALQSPLSHAHAGQRSPVITPRSIARRAEIGRARRGGVAYRAGLAAEDCVARVYQDAGAAILARRWRRREGEIDLIVREPHALVFVEVKRRKASISEDPVGERQWRRLEAAAQVYIFAAETGDATLRFDLALVGADGMVEIVRNARC